MLSLQCPKCGATIKFDEDHIGTFCTFCGAHLGDMTEYVKKAANYKLEEKKAKLATRYEEVKLKRDRASNFSDLMEMILTIVVIAGVAIPLILLYLNTRR